MGVASGCGEQEAGVASGSGWNLWVWLVGVVVRRYIDFLILLIPTPLVFHFFAAASLLFKCFLYKAEELYTKLKCADLELTYVITKVVYQFADVWS